MFIFEYVENENNARIKYYFKLTLMLKTYKIIIVPCLEALKK